MILFLLFFLFPYANEKRPVRRPVMTRLLILLNTALFGAILVCGGYEEDSLFWDMAYVPGRSPAYTMLTCAFAHGGVLHLFFNMWFLHLIGGPVEDRTGRIPFLLFYLGGALISSWAYSLYSMLLPEPIGMIGASGAVYAVMGMYFILYPFEDFRFWYFIFFRWGTLRIATLFFVTYKVLGDLLMAWTEWKFGAFGLSGTAHWSHLGGLIYGVAVALIVFGAYPFTGKKRMTTEEKKRRRLFRKVARRKFYTDVPLPKPMTEQEYALATDDCTPREAIERGVFFHSGRMIEWGYQELLFENPKTCLEPPFQLKMIETLRVHGRDSLAEIACWNLLEAHPSSPEAIQVRFILGCSLARIPDMRKQAAKLLRDFLSLGPAPREKIEAQRVLRRLEERPLWQWRGNEK